MTNNFQLLFCCSQLLSLSLLIVALDTFAASLGDIVPAQRFLFGKSTINLKDTSLPMIFYFYLEAFSILYLRYLSLCLMTNILEYVLDLFI